MHALARQHDGECVSTTYTDISTKLRWRCSENHEWDAVPSPIRKGTWCPFCAGKRIWSPGLTHEEAGLERCRSIATEHGGKCLSLVYVNTSTKVRWCCDQGHEWNASPQSVRGGSWCPKCWMKEQPNKRLWRIEDCRAMALDCNGVCLSEKYGSANEKLRWRCTHGHEWEARPSDIKQGYWCPTCGIKKRSDARRLNIEDCHALATKHGGVCLSESYISAKDKLRWRCSHGHEWDARPSGIKSGRWCPKCGIQRRAATHLGSLEECQSIAHQRGGECISVAYRGALVKHWWRCSDGHEWETTPSIIKGGSWCPQCSGGLNEELVRRILETLTRHRWPKARPDWLLNVRGRRMELDGFCKILQIGFEYHGEQHFNVVPHFHRKNKSLPRQQSDDRQKRRLCLEHGVKLIEVPFTIDMIGMLDFLVAALSEATGKNVVVPDGMTIHSFGYDRGLLEELHSIAENKNGLCLSTIYLGAQTKHHWRCAQGHEWEARPSSIKRGHWCPFCAGHKIWSPGQSQSEIRLAQCNSIAKERGGALLSTVYLGTMNYHRWRCSEGHTWEATPSCIKRGSWCPTCSKRKAWATRRQRQGQQDPT